MNENTKKLAVVAVLVIAFGLIITNMKKTNMYSCEGNYLPSDYSVKGHVTYVDQSTMAASTLYDTCLNSNQLVEYYCHPCQTRPCEWSYLADIVSCTCSDGVCVGYDYNSFTEDKSSYLSGTDSFNTFISNANEWIV